MQKGKRGEMAQSTRQILINSSQQHWNDKIPKGEKNMIGDVLLESEPHWVVDPNKRGSTIV